MDHLTVNAYDAEAPDLAQRYERAEPREVHAFLRRFVSSGLRVLDAGCGSGRDAAFMKKLGADVFAVDAAAAMVQQAVQTHPELAGRVQQASFPVASQHALLGQKFDVITCQAMLMHVPDEELFDLAFQFKQMLEKGGLLIVSASVDRQGLSDNRDGSGRLFLERPAGEIQLLFERLGFRLLEQQQSSDAMGRQIRWYNLVFKLVDEAGKGPVDQIETIINRDKKDATYKLALLRALCDIAQTEQKQARWHIEDTVSVPLGLLAEKWLFYYWPLIELDVGEAVAVIPQKRGLEINTPIAFRAPVLRLIAHCSRRGGMDVFFHDFRKGALDTTTARLADTALNGISNTIVSGPVKYSGGALDSGGSFFWRTGGITRRNRCISSASLVQALGEVHMRGEVWRELTLLGHWIGEALILRWAELTHEISRQQVPVARVIERLLIHPENDREQQLLRHFYRQQLNLTCVWSGQALNRKFDVDHLIPFGLWHNNDLWNLLPALPKINNQKRDKLVTRRVLHDRRDAIIGYWEKTRESFGDRFDYELARSLTGGQTLSRNWKAEAFSSLAAAVETVALQRGIPRWEPDSITAGAASTSATREGSREILPFDEIPQGHSNDYLPIVGQIAAGQAYDGFLTDRLENAQGCDWIRVPKRLRGENRFVVRIAGNSMSPTLEKGDLVVFEYHRRPRQQDQIVVAALAEFGTTTGTMTETVKRLHETPTAWHFTADNPAYPSIAMPKTETDYPILGTMAGMMP